MNTSKKSFFLLISVFFALSQVAFSQVLDRVISPAPGIWANKQSLVIDTSDGSECFYSYSGSDPLTSGLAYDGPVLIDAEGSVDLKIAVLHDGGREEYKVSYSVVSAKPSKSAPATAATSASAQTLEDDFYKKISSQAVWNYKDGERISIPSSLFYKIGDGEKPYLRGTDLSLDITNCLSRYVPCSVTDGSADYRFVIFVPVKGAGQLATFDVPFKITDWNTFTFTGKKLIWCIDDSDWSASTEPIKIDRSIPHTVRWQSVVYQKGNPIECFTLAPKPQISVSMPEKRNASAFFKIEGDSHYMMSLLDANASGEQHGKSGLFREMTFDTFYGDEIRGQAKFALYSDGVYQGEIDVPYEIDKQPPLPPAFAPSEEGYYARSSVSLAIESTGSVFYSVSKAVPLRDTEVFSEDSKFDSVETGDFRPYFGAVDLIAGTDKAVFYKVKAYSQDKAGNRSAISEYRVIIDEYNYYISESAPELGADGTFAHPFTSFDQIRSVLNNGKFAHFFVEGTLHMPAGITSIGTNCAFTSAKRGKEGRILLPASASIVVRSASFAAENIIIEKEKSDELLALPQFFTLEHGAVSFENVEIIGVFEDSGTAFTAKDSVLRFSNTGLTIHAANYACGISASNCKISVSNGRFASVAPTAVNFSIFGGTFDLAKSDCKVVSHLGRIAELTGTKARLNSNVYTGEFDSKNSAVEAVWKDEKSVLLADMNNKEKGFAK